MPELPEVETVRRQLEPLLTGRTVAAAGAHPSSKFVEANETVGARFCGVDRRGKYLLLPLSDGRELVAHLGMTGAFAVYEPDEPLRENTHRRAWWNLDDQRRLEFVDVRRFGRLRVVPAGEYSTMPTLHNAGPEPFDSNLTGDDFWRLLRQSGQSIKARLLSQRPIAGVGNIYADEALWLAGINPKATRLGKARAAELLDAIRTSLEQGVENGGTTLRDYRNVDGDSGTNQHSLQVYGRGGQPCLRCGTRLRVATVAARTTTWCPACQRR